MYFRKAKIFTLLFKIGNWLNVSKVWNCLLFIHEHFARAKSTDLAGQAGFTAKESDFSPVMKFVTI
jgi:hypothetical protein